MERGWIERPFLEEEVHNSIMGMKGDKVPGLDGFTIPFFQRCWNIVKIDLMKVLDEIYHSEELYETFEQYIYYSYPQKEKCNGIERLSSH